MAKLMSGAAGMGKWITKSSPERIGALPHSTLSQIRSLCGKWYFAPEAALRLLPTGLSHTLQMPLPRQGILNLLITTAC